MPSEDREIVFNHFNDVYHINNSQLVSRFSHTLRDEGITVFSGDAMSPSLESSVLRGEHIVPVLNHLHIDVASYGNHDFDFGEERLKELSDKCNFPWVLSNAFHHAGTLLASAKPYVLLEHAGLKIGFFGLAGTDWPSNCQNLPSDMEIRDPAHAAREMSHLLRTREGADLVVAVTHMRLEEDLLVSEACREDVDLILGGHDHDIVVHGDRVTVINDTAEGHIRIVKSGTDFRSFSRIRVTVRTLDDKQCVQNVAVQHVGDLSLLHHHPEDARMRQILMEVHDRISSISSERLLYAVSALDGRSTHIRTAESNLGNLLADAVRAYYNSDIAFVNSGSIRCDKIVPAGELTVRDIIDIVPFDNTLVVKRLSGNAIIRALENSVSDARTDGRFLQLSGIALLADLRQSENSRVIAVTLSSGEALSPERFYAVAMTSFIADGFDGYHFLKDSETLVNEEGAVSDTSLMLRIFRRSETSDHGLVNRARKAIVLGERNGLPYVAPALSDRITFASAL